MYVRVAEAIFSSHGLSPREVDLIAALLAMPGRTGNRVVLNKYTRIFIMECMGIRTSRVSNLLRGLMDKEALVRTATGHVEIAPYFVAPPVEEGVEINCILYANPKQRQGADQA